MTTVQGTLAAEDRLTWLRERLSADGSVSINDAATALGVSEMTIRRDLIELEDQGLARRVRGGARPVGPESFTQRRQIATRAKGRIAAKLAPLVPASGVVAFDASSTVMRLGASLGATRDLAVLTNGPDTFFSLRDLPGVTPLLTGGQLEPRTGSLVGPLACRSASQLAAQVLFLSAAAVDPVLGGLEVTIEEAEVKRAMVDAAERVVLAVDASKLGCRSTAVSVGWDQIDLLVTDLDPDDERLAHFAGLVEVI